MVCESRYAWAMLKLVMADDHAIVRTGFRALIEQAGSFRILAECGDCDAARTAVLHHKPDALVLDISLPGGGLNLAAELRQSQPELRILILSMHAGDPYLSEAMRLGVAGYVSKGSAADELIAALRSIEAGERYLSSDLHTTPVGGRGLGQLSEREREVFLRLARGQTPKQVALDLDISVKTAYLHRASIREKLGVNTDLQLHQLALAQGLLD